MTYIFDNNYDFITALPAVKKKDFKRGCYNHPASFDIETTSFYSHDDKHEKTAIMYIWQYAIKIDDNYYCVYGRSWQTFFALMLRLKFMLGLDDKHKMIIYVHNLSYEFQFIRKLFTWDKVFALESRKVCYAIADAVEFRCSYLLSGYSLDNLAKVYDLETKKLKMDYSTIRTPLTALTRDEIDYCLNDVKVVCDYITLKIQQYNDVGSIPLTQTGEVRKEARKKVLHPNKPNKRGSTGYYIQERLRLNDTREFLTLRQAFQGGFTHANAFEVGETIQDVSSFDFTSSYPYVMISEMFPMSKGKYFNNVSRETYEKTNQHFLTVAFIHLHNVKQYRYCDCPISLSRVIKPRGAIDNNGRIVTLDDGYMVLTNIDLDIYKQFYTFGYDVIYMYRYRKAYLPKEYVSLVMEYYNKKTTLKGIPGKEIEYMHSKQKLNSLYGMMVTNPMRDEIILNAEGEWITKPADVNAFVDDYNKLKNRFTFYPWGVFVTAYARRNLFTGIKEFDRDYIYSDTDSIKVRNKDKHMDYIESYNRMTQYKIMLMCKTLGLEYRIPKTVKGVPKPIGVWDYEGTYTEFKTLGAKRYLSNDNGIHATVAGVSKRSCENYLMELSNGDPSKAFEYFTNDLTIPKEKTGKNILTYIDDDRKGTLVDCQGNEYDYHEKSCIHMEETSFCMSMSSTFLKYLTGIRNKTGVKQL